MATRDKKARSVTADSPTPSLGSANSGSSGNISALAISSSSTGAASGNDSAPTTPTSTRKAAAVASTVAAAGGGSSSSGGSGSTNTSSTRGSLSRLKSKQQLLQQGGGADEGAVDELAGIESIAVAATTTTTPSRTTRGGSALLREDSAGRESPAAKDDTTATTTTTTAGPGGASKDLTKSPAIGARRAAATATTTATTATTTSSKPAATAQSKKKRVVTLKRAGLLKRKGKKIIGKPMLGRKVEARRQLVTAAKSTGTRGAAATVKDVLADSKEKEEEATAATTPSLRNGKPRNSDSPVAKRKVVLKQQEAAGSSNKSPDSASMERRRSGSVLTEDGAEQTVAEMKRELLDYESRSKMLDKMAEAFNERKAAGGGAASPVVEKGTLRRSMRQRKSTAREELAPPARGKSVGGGSGTVEIKLEPAESLESLTVEGSEQDSSTAAVSVDAPLTIDTTVATVDGGVACEPLHSDGTTVSSLGGVSSGGVIAGASGTASEEVELGSVVGIGGGSAGGSGKDPSLSPGELVSEGVSEQSVKECYSEPAFLENNLGIEKDPKLGEIVQGRFRCDKVSDDAEDNAKSETVGDNAASDNGEEGGVGGSATKDADQEVEEEETVAHEAGEGVETVQKVKQEVQEDTASVGEDREITIEGVKVEEEPMEQDEEEEEEIGKELPVEEKMDITEEEVMECVKIKEEPEEDVAAVVLEEAKGDGDTSSKTDHVPAKDANEAQESNRRPDSAGSAVDEEAGASRASSAGGAVVAPSDGEVSSSSTTSKTPTDDASSPVPVASVPCKANGDSNGTTTGDQSTPNQQSSRTGGQQRPSTGATPKTASKSSSTPVAAATASTAGTLSPATGKESKPKTRTTKEKSKEDEKTREEKLRQEKLRVEEKVREEKQRAERLEAERRLKEEQQQQQQHQQQVLENGHEEEQPSPASGSGGPQDEQEHKTDTAPVPALLALGGLNLPAITIALTSKKDDGSSDEKEEAAIVPKKCELEILPIKADGGPPPAVVLLSKEEKPAKEGGAAAAAPSLADTAESRLRTASKGENAAASLSAVAERKDSSNKSSSPLTVLKQGTSNGSPSPPPATGKDAASTTTTTPPPDESDDAAKASHLLNLGLLTIRAADEEKQRRAEQKPSSSADGGAQDGGTTGGNSSSQGTAGKGSDGWLAAGTAHSGGGSGRAGNKSTRSSKDEYTVSMKTTVLKGGSGSGSGSRGEKRKQQRMPLKMTFQKGKGKGGGRESSNGSGSVSSNGSGYATDTGNNGDNTFYTVHSNEVSNNNNRFEPVEHTRRNGVNLTEAVGESVSSKEVSQKSLVIPEKASSFNVHPERLCRDQCSYCGGKFGLYDTPCHVAAIKSTERQQRILLATLPKITLDSCLCDACYRHVDRKANCPPQKKKSSTVSQTSASTGAASSSSSSTTSTSTTNNNSTATQSTVSPLVLKVTTNKDGSTSIATEQPATAMEDGPTAGGKAREICAVRQCTAHAMQSLRRKWMVKMKRKIGKQLDINLEQAAKATAEYISICNKHYEQISHLMICAMCTKPLQRNHVYHLYNNVPQLERLIQEQGISMRLSSSELVVCKLCKYYANLLIKPPETKTKKAQFVNDYNRRLLCRQRAAEEQREQQAEAAVTVTAVAPAAVPRQRQPMPVTDIVISDGDEEEEEAEDEEVEETTITESQSQQHPLPARYQTLGDIFSIGDSSVSVRRRVSSRKSPDVTIVESNGATQMSELEEISIIPTSKSLSALHQQQQQQSRDDNIDMTQVLKSNPNISMRELFPGEEELGVHVNIPFSSSSMRTPEGWTKVQSTIQYDDSTRALWEELQKPYGNQSSFLRHLLLLEKYFRNGDLVLSPQAKTSATTYSEAVQNRLRSYDNVPSVVPSSPPALASLTPAATAPTVAADKTSHIFQQFSSATITIVPANKVRPRTSAGGGSSSAEITPVSPPAPVSLLKSNNLHLANSGDQGATKQSLKRKLSIESGGRTSGGASAITSPLNSSSTVGGGSTKVVRLDEPKAPLSSPPELISISNRKASVTITTIPPAAAQSATVGSPPAVATATAQKQLSLLQQPQQSLLQSVAAVDAVTAAAATLLAKKSPTAGATATTANTPTGPSSTGTTGSANASATTTAREIIQMPEQLTEAERRESSTRPWRPTLLPIAPGVSESLKTGPLYQTADGRTLPKLVQVMSGGKPYHISIEDYNRMCILRREKLLQQQQNMMQQQQQQQQTVANKRQSQLPQPNKQPSAAATTLPPPPALRLASTAGSVENNNGSANSVAVSVASSAKVVQLPNQLLEQNSLIPILSGSSGANKMGNVQKNSSLTVTMTTTVNNNSLAKSSSSSSSSATATVPPSMKPLSLPNSTTVYPMLMSANTLSLPSLFATSSAGSLPVSSVAALFSEVNAAMTQTSSPSHRPAPAATSLVLGQPTSLLTTTTSSSSSSASAATAAVLNPFEHLFKDGNKVTQAQLQEFVAIATAANGGGSSSLLDNSSPAQLLSKIPKSLTVIPQQKQRSMSRVSSHEDQNSA
ncbi:AGAP002715-PA [Anopheles gambiae str. PEST]|uniref:AGAP002715-PA n=1 Tax=Anopheles gambiae TaxID=7165 RepID=A7UST4_ANOGA|nr:AGAP002715-PA [Anopheles gambiae str. PEST]